MTQLHNYKHQQPDLIVNIVRKFMPCSKRKSSWAERRHPLLKTGITTFTFISMLLAKICDGRLLINFKCDFYFFYQHFYWRWRSWGHHRRHSAVDSFASTNSPRKSRERIWSQTIIEASLFLLLFPIQIPFPFKSFKSRRSAIRTSRSCSNNWIRADINILIQRHSFLKWRLLVKELVKELLILFNHQSKYQHILISILVATDMLTFLWCPPITSPKLLRHLWPITPVVWWDFLTF